MVAYTHKDVPVPLLLNYSRLCPMVEVRKYDFTNLPEHVERNLFNYAFKPIMIQRFIKEADRFMFIDASIIFQKGANDTIKSLFDSMEEFPCGIRHVQSAKHTVFSATNPETLKHFNFSEEQAKNSEMIASGLYILSKTNESEEIVNKWADCAMVEECMSPPG
ncbi:hypothetical protein FO519_010568, partial [Halicephalobus sp. NKZ332]